MESESVRTQRKLHFHFRAVISVAGNNDLANS